MIGVCRMTVRYQTTRPDDGLLRERMKALAHERRRFGYRRLHVLLRREGHVVNHKRLFRIYREERLTVRRRGGRKRAMGTRAPMLIPLAAQRALVARLRLRSAHRRPALPHPDGGRRLHPRVPGPGRRHLAVRDAGGPRARPAHRRARQAGDDRQRQRHRVDLERHPHLGRRQPASTGTTSRRASRPRTPSSRASTAGCGTNC